MASHSAFVILVLFAIVPITTLAKEYIVGDESGWTPGFDYQAWAQGKIFQVGDKLVFRYLAGAHNVFKVNGTAFHNCTIPPLDQALTTGNDTILLATPGNKWYICGVGKHCESGGQKLAITVQAYAPTPSPVAAPSPLTSIPYELGTNYGTPSPSPSMAPSPLSPIPYTGSGSEVVTWEYGTPAPSPVGLVTWEYGTPAPSPVGLVTWEYGTPAPSPVDLATWEYEAPTPSPVDHATWGEYDAPAPSPVELGNWEYDAPAPSPVKLGTWEYEAPAPPPVKFVHWEYEAPAPSRSPAAGMDYQETAGRKRPFINFYRG